MAGVVATGITSSLIWAAPCAALVLVFFSHQPAFAKILLALVTLGLVANTVLEYRGTAVESLESGIREYEFEALGASNPRDESYLGWVLLKVSDEADLYLPGRLESSDSLIASTRYRAFLEVKPIQDRGDRAGFWALQTGPLVVVEPPGDSDSFFIGLRKSFMENLRGLSPDSAALVAGLAIGDRTLLSHDLSERMKDLSLSHLVAVSGANLAIVAGGVYLLLAAFGLRRVARAVGAFAAIVAYIALVGPEPSVLRAGFMAAVVILGQMLGRGNQSLNGLSLAILILVCLDPFLALEFGFALSALATFGLLVLAPALFQSFKQRVHPFVAGGLAVSISAQLYTLPVLLLIENRLATYSVVANILVEPVVAPVTVLGIASVVTSIAIPQIGALLSFLASLGTAWIEEVAKALSAMPAVSIAWLPQPFATLISGLLVVAVTLYVIRREWKWLLSAIALLILSVSWATTNQIRAGFWPATDWDVIACDVAQGDALLIQSHGSVMLIDTGREPELLMQCLRQAGVSEIDILALSHFDADHVAAVPELLELVTVTQTIISGFDDDRELTGLVMDALRGQSVPITVAQAGMSFRFGDGIIRVLQPSLNAREATDSNDASVILAGEFPTFSVLALGDLGEVGQQRLLRNQQGIVQKLARQPLVLKVSHHGSKDQSNELIAALKSDWALISVGLKNGYGHPTAEAISYLEASGARVFRTDTSGSIALDLDFEPTVFVAGKL